MICPDCYGKGYTDDCKKPVCENCGGVGIIHCCEGDRCQDEDDYDRSPCINQRDNDHD
jgi:hypothetical protein